MTVAVLPGPQTQARDSLADELFYGGAGGGGKTALLAILALTLHQRSIIFRPTFKELREFVRQLKDFGGDAIEGSANTAELRVGRRSIELGYMQHEDDKEKYRGNPHDFLGVDEATSFTRSQIQFVCSWLRTTASGQRCRVVLTGNPPSTPEGRWIVEDFAPWLDKDYPDPAKPGELRWYVRNPDNPDEILWQKDDAPVIEPKTGRAIRPLSRTFIPALVSDNPFLGDDYFARLNAQPEPLRSQMLFGDFTIGMQDDAWQCIPTSWLRAAHQRWTAAGGTAPLHAIGLDVAYGGADATCAVERRGRWFSRPDVIRGDATDSGLKAAEFAMTKWTPGAAINVDAIGYGVACYEHLQPRAGRQNVSAIVFSEGSDATDRSGKWGFANLRAEAYWKLREALDPDRGDSLAIPPDGDLTAELTAIRYEVRGGRIVIGPKDEVKERLGRSPDRADAVVLAAWEPPKKVVSSFFA